MGLEADRPIRDILSIYFSSSIAKYIKAHAEHYPARAAACRGYHMGSPQELPHTVCDPLIPLLVAFYDPRLHTGKGVLYPRIPGGRFFAYPRP
jgi:hypothetical protein